MKKLVAFLTLVLIAVSLLTSCDALFEPAEDTNGTDKTFDTVTIASAAEDFKSENNEFKNYLLAVTVKRVYDAESGVFSVSDETGTLKLSLLYGEDDKGARINYENLDNKPTSGDSLVIRANLKKDANDNLIIWRATILAHTDGEPIEYAIKDAREEPVGEEVEVEGVVAAITYAFGESPSGVILVDGTSSIYVYDDTIAKAVRVGNKITVSGTKAYWVLADEQANAAKFGYKGSCQIESATLVKNDGGSHEFDKSWIESTTVMDLLNTPVTENITTKLYKVNALVKEVPGAGFTNYYFFDIDGETSTYAYTQCNGADFAWLRAYDGKICTVYLTALNAKSTSSDCYFRFLPVSVIDEGYEFDKKDAPAYAVKYHGLTQIKNSYTGDPELILNTVVSSELLGFEGASLTFSSSDESIIKFTLQTDGTVLMNCPGIGTTTVTISARFENYSYSESIEITVSKQTVSDYITVEEALSKENGTEVVIKGIVGPSFVHANRRGFYLVGSGKVVSVSFTNAADLADIQIGNTVYIKGTKDTIKKNNSDDYTTHIFISEASLVYNEYGNAELPVDVIVDDEALADIVSTENSTVLFKAQDKVVYNDSQYSKTYSFGGITLYSSSATQYSLLDEFRGQDVTALLSVVNWNGKGAKLTLVGVITSDGVIYNEFSFEAK